ncbi:MAG: hypothetical protein Q4D41_10945 [Prevotellaceae bacterium]|nr:hypothetical protein [Prevotellaceae bacterium]
MQLPETFRKRIESLFDCDLWNILEKGLAGESPVSVRLNPRKTRNLNIELTLSDGEVPWCKGGYYLSERPNFTFDPLLHSGLYYVQEASSMFLDCVMRQYLSSSPVVMLDLCAAPGGKSTVARAALPEGSLLVSNEPMRTRAQILAENIQKFGHPDVIVTNNYAKDIERSGLMFDVILADVPCSGEGMFRKDQTAIDEWSVQNVEKCWHLQREIISDIWNSLRPGGLLIYSTCTFNAEENEENVRYITEELGAELLPVDIKDEWQITGSVIADFQKPVYRFVPGKTRGEGLFMAVMRKLGDCVKAETKTDKKKKRESQKKKPVSGITPCMAWLDNIDDYEITESDNRIIAVPKQWKNIYDVARKSLKVLSAGVMLGEAKGKDIIPSHSLALSIALNKSSFPCVELNYEQAISYLRKEAVSLPESTPRGYVIVTYKSQPLGFEKNIGNRANNLYPQEWKIKSSHTPDGINEFIKII